MRHLSEPMMLLSKSVKLGTEPLFIVCCLLMLYHALLIDSLFMQYSFSHDSTNVFKPLLHDNGRAPSCPEIVLKSAIVLKFYSFGQNVLIWTFVMLSLHFFYKS